jgi:hypothetical protein
MTIPMSSNASSKLPEPSTSFAQSLFLYVKIPFVKSLIEQLPSWEDAIDQVLREKGAGSVLGWGSSLGEALPDGSRDVAFTRIDINVTDLAAARTALQATLPALGSPQGTEIHYTLEHRNLEDHYTPSGWLLDQPVLSSRHSPGLRRR